MRIATSILRWSALVALVSVSGLVADASPTAADAPELTSGYVEPAPGEPVPVTEVAPAGRARPAGSKHVWQPPAGVVWPKPAVSVVDLAAPRAAGSPVTVSAPTTHPVGLGRPVSPKHPSAVRVRVLGRAATRAAGVSGVLLGVDAVSGSGEVALAVDYAGFSDAFGGGWGSRLRLLELPACVLRTPHRAACRAPTPVESENDTDARRVSATVAVEPSAPSVFALTADESSETGDYTATGLEASGSWSHGGSSGAFTYTYPLRVPPAAGPLPEVALSYSSQSHDGRTSGSNNQASWVGDGWGYQPGLIERTYTPCARDQDGGSNAVKTGDLCWDGDSPAVTMSLNGVSTPLVKDAGSGQWRAAADQGWRIEKLGSPATPSTATTERWRVTTTDGTRYLFAGVASSAHSRWTVPVFGNHTGEPCHASGFAGSSCRQVWRWLLDKVVDTSGNVTRYFYATETGHYAAALDPDDRLAYHRSGRLTRIEYGLRDGGTAPPAGRVLFTTADRCLSDCYTGGDPKTASWPDTPWDLTCESAPCTDGPWSPAFFSSKRLARVTTQVRDGSGFRDVDSWQLTHQLLDYGDESQVVLWLRSIRHTGHVGGTRALPAITFTGWSLPNRVDHNGVAAIWRSRLSSITTEAGGVITVNYSGPDCAAGDLPSAPESNTRRCFPAWWTPELHTDPMMDWFHKYVVESVAEQDPTAAGDTVWTSYDYSTAGGGTSVLWGWDDSELTKKDHRTYSQWRGYPQVTERVGDPAEGARLTTRTRYYRGMHGQRLPGGGTRSVRLTDAEGNTVTDHEALSGAIFETAAVGGDGIESSTTYRYWTRETATRSHDGGELEAWLTGITREESRQRLTGSTWRRTRIDTSFDSRGRPVAVSDRGDVARGGDERCTRTEYADSTSRWILDAVSRTETVAVTCTATPSRPADVISDTRTYHDGSSTLGAPPTRGLPTRTEVLDRWSGGPVYVRDESTGYDALGRVTSTTDALGHTSTTAYTPAGAGPVTRKVLTNPLGHASTTHLEPAWGQPTATVDPNGRRTDLTYDPLGRVTAVWLPGMAKGSDPASRAFSYEIRNDQPSAVTTRRLTANRTYATTVALYDSLLREVQTQTDTPLGGRLVTETNYNTRGQVRYSSGPNWDGTSGPNGTFVRVAQGADHARTLYAYDALGRTVSEALWSKNVKLWETTTAYGGGTAGFLTRTTPPDGATPTGTITNARGEVIEKREYHEDTATGPYDATTYAHDRKGRLATVTDPAGNNWSYEYDLRGRRVASHDPDSGTTTAVYDAAGRVTSTTDARGETVSQVYDALGRRVERWAGGTGSGELIATWTYDTVAGGVGLPATASAYVDGHEISTGVGRYDAAGRPTRSTTTVPPIPGLEELAGSYWSIQRFNVDGTLATRALPGVAGLPREGITYTYNDLGMPDRMVGDLVTTGDTQVYVDSTTWTAHGELAQRTLGASYQAQVYQTYSYEDGTRRRGELRLSRDAVGATNVAHLRYSYDAAGNVLSIADAVEDPFGQPERQCFAYDHLRRLAEAWAQAGVGACAPEPSTGAMGGPAPYWSSYTFDVTGNRLSETWHGVAGGSHTSTYAYPAGGTPQPHTLASVTTGGQVDTYTWDAAGNMTSRTVDGRTETVEWDARGKPVRISGDSGSTGMVYDQDGDRVARMDPNGDVHLFLTGHEISYTAATGTVTAVRVYEHGGDVVATRSSAGDGLQWLGTDHHATATWAIDADSMAVTTRRQDPYGNPRGPLARWPSGQEGFVRGIADPTGLVHVGARAYDPATGRFISGDPITDLQDTQQVNGYTYANGNPVTASDPTGLRACIDWCGSPADRSVQRALNAKGGGGKNGASRSGGARRGKRAAPTAKGLGSAPPVVKGFGTAPPADDDDFELSDCTDYVCRVAEEKRWEEHQRRLDQLRDCTDSICRAAEDKAWEEYCGEDAGAPGCNRPPYRPRPPEPASPGDEYVDEYAENHLIPFEADGWYVSYNECLVVCVSINGTSEGISWSRGGFGCCGPGVTAGWNDAPSSAQDPMSWVTCAYYFVGMCHNTGTRGTDGSRWHGVGVTFGVKLGGQTGPMWTSRSWCPWC